VKGVRLRENRGILDDPTIVWASRKGDEEGLGDDTGSFDAWYLLEEVKYYVVSFN
jgi:hypothetical protein